MSAFRPVAAAVWLAAVPQAHAADIPLAVLTLHVPFHGRAGEVAEAAPPRFVMLESGEVFTGGTSEMETCRLEGAELERFRSQIATVREPVQKKKNVVTQPWLTGPTMWSFGGMGDRVVLTFFPDAKEKLPLLRLEATGEPRSAPIGLKPLADFIVSLAEFDHPCLRPYAAASYRLRVAPGTLPGGCRAPGSLAEALPAALGGRAVAVSAAAAKDWPHGATAAQVCHQDKRYVVNLTPLLPGEQP